MDMALTGVPRFLTIGCAPAADITNRQLRISKPLGKIDGMRILRSKI